MPKKYIYILIPLLLIPAAFGVYIFSKKDKDSSSTGPLWGNVEIYSQEDDISNEAENNQYAFVDFENPKEFIHETHNFSFLYPGNLSVGRFDEGDGETIVIQNAEERVGFQIYITSVGEEIIMTRERIQEDLPDLEVRDPRPVQLGEQSGQGLAFLSDNESYGGSSREVWFTFNGYLYQISTYASLDPLLQQVLNSWEFR